MFCCFLRQGTYFFTRVQKKKPKGRKTYPILCGEVLAELKAIFKADAGLELNVNKTSILPHQKKMLIINQTNIR